MSLSQPPPEFFVDRSLGRRRVAEALRRTGWSLCTHHEVFGGRDEEVHDVEWLEYCGRQGLPVLTNDRRLRYNGSGVLQRPMGRRALGGTSVPRACDH